MNYKSIEIEGMTMYVSYEPWYRKAYKWIVLGLFILLLVLTAQLLFVLKAVAVSNYAVQHGFTPVTNHK